MPTRTASSSVNLDPTVVGVSLLGIALLLTSVVLGAAVRDVVLLVLIALCAIGATRSDRVCWIVYVASTVASGRSLSVAGLTILPEHFALFLVVVRVLSEGPTVKQPAPRRLRSLDGHAVLLASWVVLNLGVSLLLAPEPSQSLRLLTWTASNVIALSLLLRWRIPGVRMARDGLVTVSSLFAVFIALWAQANATGIANSTVDTDYASEAFRAKGLMLEPNLFAGLALLWLTVAYVYRRSLPTGIILFALGILGLGIVATYTRASLLGLVIVGSCLIWESSRRGRTGSGRVRLLLWSVAVGLLIWQLTAPTDSAAQSTSTDGVLSALSSRVENLFTLTSGTGAYRLNAVSVALSEIFSGEWLGHGYNSFPQDHFDSLTSDGRSYLGVLWVALLYDGGLIGLALFVALFVMAWRTAPSGAWIYFVCFIAVSTATNPIWYAFPWVTIAVILKGRGEQPHPPLKSRSRPERLGIRAVR